uniref:Zinc finger protein 800-like isoform X2 n=1 Tax=Petromyzon marinus TaxID=7757 RepID=A0AAJ7TR11_PETMA|nr:zinc finger protein 800-like isoform X2 [Petromyzon marinus]
MQSSDCGSLMDATALPPDSTRSSCPAELEMEVEGAQGADEPGAAAGGCPGVRDQACQADLRATRSCAEAAELGDPPLVQQQLHTSRHGVRQILECLRVGTPRLKQLLLCEVDIIFECQLCRSLFRGLPNLIVHRQNYCHPYTCTDDTFFEEDNNNNNNHHRNHRRDTIPEPARPQEKRVDFVIQLDPIATNRNAVYQHVITSDDPEWEARVAAEPGRQGPSGTAPVVPTEAKEAGPEPKAEATVGPAADQTASVLSPISLGYSCAVCAKSFRLRRSVRRHIRVVHKKLAEEVNRYFCLDAAAAAALAQGQATAPHDRKACPVCHKSFANKANVRRHFHDTHHDAKWEVAWKESRSPGRAQPSARSSLSPPWSLTPVKVPAPAKRHGGAGAEILVWICPMCNRKHGSLIAIKRHLQLFHKQNNFMTEGDEEAAPPSDAPTEGGDGGGGSGGGGGIGSGSVGGVGGVGGDQPEDSSVADVQESKGKPPEQKETPTKAGAKDRDPKAQPPPDKLTHKDNLCTICGHAFPSRVEYRKHMSTTHAGDVKPEQNGTWQPAEPETPAKGGGAERQQSPRQTAPRPETKAKGKLFDLRQLYCRLCKRRFSTRQNLRKHIEMHTDGDRLYVKFFRCPLCSYESRRKSDILRHLTVVHKHTSCYLRRVAGSLESRSIKKPVDAFLNRKIRRGRLPHSAGLRVKAEPGAVTRTADGAASGGGGGGESSAASPLENAGTPASVATPVKAKGQAAAPTTPTTPTTQTTALTAPKASAAPAASAAPKTPAAHPASSALPYQCDECGKTYTKKSFLDNHKLVHVRRGRKAGQKTATAATERSKRSSFPCRNTRSRSVNLSDRRRQQQQQQQQPPAK